MKNKIITLARYGLLGCASGLFAPSALAAAMIDVQQSRYQAPQPAPVQTEVIVDSASEHWSNLSVKITNTLPNPIDLNGMVVTFVSPQEVTSAWGNFTGVSYPDAITASSTATGNGDYLVQITTTFGTDSWVNSELATAGSIALQFGLGVNATPDILSDVKVYLDGVDAPEGAITLYAPQAPGSDVANEQAVVTLSGPNGYQKTVSMDWQQTETIEDLLYGAYTLHVNPVGGYPADPAEQEKSLTEEQDNVSFTWGYGEAVLPASFKLQLPSDELVEQTTLTLTNQQSGEQSFYTLPYGQTTQIDDLVHQIGYSAELASYTLNNVMFQLTMDGELVHTFTADKDQVESPLVAQSSTAIDTDGFFESRMALEGLAESAEVAVTLIHSGGDMYQHQVSTGDAQVYDQLRPGVYTVKAPAIDAEDGRYELTTTSITVNDSATYTLAFAKQGGEQANILAPYKDTSINADWANGGMESLVDLANNSGNKHFTLAFILGSEWNPNECKALWGGQPEMTVADQWGKKQIDDLRAIGGDVMISFGGANGRYLSQACGTVDELYREYKAVIDTYQVYHLDFDVEMGRENDAPAMARMIEALKRLQTEYPQLKVSYTLAAAPDIVRGFNEVVVPSVEAGIEIDSVNPMTMSFGQWYHDNYVADTAELSILTVEYLKTLMQPLYPELSDSELYQKLGMIPMQGLNDLTVDSISLEQAERIASWSKEKNLKYLSFWSINRDHSCDDAWASPTCSSSKDGVPFQTESWQFSKEFLKFLDK
ncbi:chitinase [Photobacterium sanctipauli]|nr:chitinase [Photobacterium sanctipauli]